MDVFYASHFGHTERIARTLARLISQSGVPARARDLAADYPSEAEISSQDPCVLISPIRYGVHLAPARRLLRRIAPLTPHKPLFLFSVNLTARKAGKTSSVGNAYLRNWIRATGARPLLAEAIAGKLEYPRYNILDRTMIRLIMTITGGPADGKSVIDYTPWTHVAELAAQIAEAAKALSDNVAHAGDDSCAPGGGGPAMRDEQQEAKRAALEKCRTQGEKAYDDMYEAHSFSAARAAYSDAKEFFYEAIKLADELGASDEAEALRKRLEHIKAVFRRQFSG